MTLAFEQAVEAQEHAITPREGATFVRACPGAGKPT